MLRFAANAATVTARAVLYSADPPDLMRIVALDTLTAIYHRASGQTHVVAEPVPELLLALGRDECDILTLIGRLGLDNLEETCILLIERLDELVAAGLVTRA